MSQTFPLAYSLAKQPQDIILDLVGKLGRQEHARLAFIYATDANAPHLKAIVDALRLHTGIPHWVGSIGLGICCTGHEFYDEPAVAVMVTDFSEDQFDVFFFDEWSEGSQSVASSAAASHYRVWQSAFFFKYLFFDFFSDYALECCHNLGKWMWTYS